MGIESMKALLAEWEGDARKYQLESAEKIWTSLERVARKWAVHKGRDPDKFVKWLKKTAQEAKDRNYEPASWESGGNDDRLKYRSEPCGEHKNVCAKSEAGDPGGGSISSLSDYRRDRGGDRQLGGVAARTEKTQHENTTDLD